MKRTESGSQDISLPRLARLLLTLVLPASEREFFLGDLNEEFHRQLQRSGSQQTRRWYWKQALQAPGWWRRTSPDFAPAHAEAGKGGFCGFCRTFLLNAGRDIVRVLPEFGPNHDRSPRSNFQNHE
jgi:hypothetical protein